MMYSSGGMMDGMGAMMWGMGFAGLLVAIVVVVGAATLAKYIFFSGGHKG